MASIINLEAHRRRRERPNLRDLRSTSSQLVQCIECKERHPIIRLPGGEKKCLTAFFDGQYWFCRNRGCRRTWLGRRSYPPRR